jgi:hypothetical protein
MRGIVMIENGSTAMSYEEKLKLFGVSPNYHQFTSAEQYAKQFTRCSVLQDVQVVYSSNCATATALTQPR